MRTSVDIPALVKEQRAHFLTGITRDPDYRINRLKELRSLVQSHQKKISEAVRMDFRKPSFESCLSEEGFVLAEIDFILKHLKKWTAPKRLPSNVLNFPSSSRLYHEPYGVTLIMSPWNYPFQLAINPLVGAMAAGNCAVIKPSELAPATSSVVARIVNDHFPSEYIFVQEGDAEIATKLLQERWDYIFFTGSQEIGKIVARSAAEHLTPLTLELGGKSPCIIDETANIRLAARRLAWGKCLNAGQTCIAPDYLYVHREVKEAVLKGVVGEWKRFYGADPAESRDYPAIINEKHFKRLTGLIDQGKLYHGGGSDEMTRYIAPTILTGISWEDPVMQEEIFGPILPVLTFDHLDEVVELLKLKPKPLSLYLFSTSRKRIRKVISQLSFGAASVNDTIAHFGNPHIPFGGVGDSGYGAYHGRYSFENLSHAKGVLKKANWLDVPIRYAPYSRKLKWLKLAFRFNLEW